VSSETPFFVCNKFNSPGPSKCTGGSSVAFADFIYWESYGEGGPLPRRAVYLDSAAVMGGDDEIRNRKPQSGTFSGWLCCKKRFKD